VGQATEWSDSKQAGLKDAAAENPKGLKPAAKDQPPFKGGKVERGQASTWDRGSQDPLTKIQRRVLCSRERSF